MKLLRQLLIAACACSLSFGQGKKDTIPYVPVGDLTATPMVVRTGTYPTLTWQVIYPTHIGQIAVISPRGEISVTKSIYVSVTPVGVGITGTRQSVSDTPVEVAVSSNGGNYERFLFARNEQIQPQYSSYIKQHKANDKINFAARYVNENNEWSPAYSTENSQRFITLVDGDAAPHNVQLSPYTKPYVDSANKIRLGPMSALVMAELSNSAADYQDAVFIVSFGNKHSNNGHGNNIDGVDVSNPSNGNGGPNGAIDPSGSVDDEK